MVKRDYTRLSEAEKQKIESLAQAIRNKYHGIDVRESIALAIEWVNREYKLTIVNNTLTLKEFENAKSKVANLESDMDEFIQRYSEQIAGNTSLDETIDARVDATGVSHTTLKDRLDKENQEVTAQLAQTAGLGNYTETPIYNNGVLSKILKTDGTESIFTYNADGTLNTVTETILDRTVLTTMNYKDGQFTSVTRVVGGEAITYPSTLIASVDNYLVDYHDDTLFLSRNGGKTYNEAIPIPQISIIKYIHLFEGGELLVCDHTKVYYSYDWKTLHESTVLNKDGSPFVPAAYDNFTLYKKNHNRQIINGQEILCWGNYSVATGTQFENINVWYTTDKGKTVKCSYRFNEADSLPARHVHNVNFNPSDNTFWLQTGDEPSSEGEDRAHLLKGTYDIYTDVWNWSVIGSGLSFKWSTVEFYGDSVYFAHDVSGGGIKTCLYSEIGDATKHTQVMKTNNDTIGMYIGERGDMIVIQSVYGGTMSPRNFYYSEDRKNFVMIEGRAPTGYDYADNIYYAYWAPNSKGKILSGVYSLAHESLEQWKRTPSVFLDDYIRQAGYPNAFKPL